MHDELFPRWLLLKARAAEVSVVARDFGISDLGITGSVARGVDHEDSDFDFFVLRRTDDQLDKITAQRELYKRLQQILGVHVDVRPLPRMVDDHHFVEGMRRDAIPLTHVLDGTVELPNVLAEPPRRVVVRRPRTNADRPWDQIQGWVECWQQGERIGRLSFGHKRDGRLVRTTQFETDSIYQNQGVASVLARELMRSFPGCHVAFSGMELTSGGEALFQSLRRNGVPIHMGNCPMNGPICRCGLEISECPPA